MKYIFEVDEHRLEDAFFFYRAFRKVEKVVMDQIRETVDSESKVTAYYSARDNIVEGVNASMQAAGKAQFKVFESGFALEESFHIQQVDS